MARRAKHVELSAALGEQCRGQQRLLCSGPLVVQAVARNGAGNRLLQHAPFLQQRSRLVLIVFALIIHILIASGQHQEDQRKHKQDSHALTSSTERAPIWLRKSAVSVSVKRGSSALMQRKNRSLDARWNREAANTG